MRKIIICVALLLPIIGYSQNKIQGIGIFKIDSYTLSDLEKSEDTISFIEQTSKDLVLDLYDQEPYIECDDVKVYKVSFSYRSDNPLKNEHGFYIKFYRDTLYQIKISDPSKELILAFKEKFGNGQYSNSLKAPQYNKRNKWQWGDIIAIYANMYHIKPSGGNDYHGFLEIKDQVKYELVNRHSNLNQINNKRENVNKFKKQL